MGPALEGGGSREHRRGDEQRVSPSLCWLVKCALPALTGRRGFTKSTEPGALPPAALPMVQRHGQRQGAQRQDARARAVPRAEGGGDGR